MATDISSIRISVVLPSYNRASTIGYCLHSVFNQTYPCHEVIVVDDCSTDNTIEVVEAFNDPQVRCIVQPQKAGAQAARNRGIKEAQGEWIAFQDSDDEWTSNKLEKQVEALHLVNFDPRTVVHSDCWRFDEASNSKTIWKLPVVDEEKPFARLLSTPGPMFQSMLTSKMVLESIGFLDENTPSYQEWDTSIRLAKHCRFIHIREPLFVYHLHQGETISKNKYRDIAGYQYIIDKFRDDILLCCGKETYNRHLIINSTKAISFGLWEEAQAILGKSVGYSLENLKISLFARIRVSPESYRNLLHIPRNLIRRVKKGILS